MRPSITAIIPCYNVAKFCEKVVIDTLPYVTHLIVIDDGSTDATGQILQKLQSHNAEKMGVISFPKNRGKGFGLLEGFLYSLSHFGDQIIVTLDGDGQHNPQHIPALITAIQEGADLVIGTRTFKQMPFRSHFANFWISVFLRCAYPSAPFDTQSGMRAFSHSLIQEVVQKVPGGHYEMEFNCLLLALAQKRKISEIAISTTYIEKNRSSHFSPLKDPVKILWEFITHMIRR